MSAIYPSSVTTIYNNTRVETIAAGTAYTLTATPTLLDFGTTDPVMTISQAGTWLITGGVVLDATGATFAASRSVVMQWNRTNNTPADLSNGFASLATQIWTTITLSVGTIIMPEMFYTTSNTDDILGIKASINVIPSAGTIQASNAWVRAIRIA